MDEDHNRHEDSGQTLKGIVNNARLIAQALGKAMAGNIPGAIVDAARSSWIRNLAIGIAVFFFSCMFLIVGIPSLLYNSIKSDKNATPINTAILNMSSQVNGLFSADYQQVLDEINAMMEPGDTVKTETSVPPIAAYKLMAYYSASVYCFDASNTTFGIPGARAMHINENVLNWEPLIQQECLRDGIPSFASVIEAIIMQESGGGTADPVDVMQCGGASPEDSIRQGVAHFAMSAQKAGCTGCSSPADIPALQIALQNYNMGDYFSDWLQNQGLGGWSISNAQAFHNYEVGIGAGGGPNGQVYGDVSYVPHVFAYWNGSTNGGTDLINAEDLLRLLHTYDDKYFTYNVEPDAAGHKEYTVKSILDAYPDYFETVVFKLTPDQIAYAQKFEDEFAEYGDTENAAGLSNIKGAPLTSADIQNELNIALAADPSLSAARMSILQTGLGLVGKVGYFWGGKYPQGGTNPDWGQNATVTALGSGTTGMTMPLGLDCSGFIDWAVATAGYGNALNMGSEQMYTSFASTNSPEPGDLAFIINSKGQSEHVAFYLGKDPDGKNVYLQCAGGVGVIVGNGGSFNAYAKLPIN